jgi:iron complex outermembrane receptor protein
MRLKYVIVLTFFVLPALVFSQTGSLGGKIIDENAQPLEGVTVSILSSRLNALSNSEGMFNIAGIAPGSYTLTFSYSDKQTEKKNVLIEAGRVTILNLQLDPAQLQLNEVIVRATNNRKYIRTTSAFASRQELPLKDIPQSIQPIPRQVILDQQAYRMNELFKNVAGATDQSDWNYVMMRGFLTNSSNFLVNGQRGGFVGEDQFAQLSFIERAEVLKGPSGVLFGNGAIGGTFNLITKKPREEFYTSANLATGSFGLFRIQADVNGSLNKKKTILALLNIGAENGGNFYKDFRNRNILITPFFTWKPGQKTEINSMTVIRFADQTTSYSSGIPIIGDDPYAAPFNFRYASSDGKYNSGSVQQQLSIKHSFNSRWSITGWFNYSSRNDNVFIYAPGGPSPRLDSITRSIQSWEADIKGLAINTYINGSFRIGKVENNIVAGFDYLKKNDNYPVGFNYYFVSPINQNNPLYPTFDTTGKIPDYYDSDVDRIKTRSAGFYIQNQIVFSKKWKALLAIRYDDFRNDYYSELGVGFGGGLYTDTTNGNAWVPRIGLVYQPNSRISLYGSYMQGFVPQSVNRTAGGPFPPEKGNQIELGVKGSLLNGNLVPTIAVYQIIKSNVLNGDPTDPNGLRRTITGKARSRGVELTLAGNLTPNWNILANYAHNRTIILKDTDQSKEGQEFGDTPNDMFSFWTTYQLTSFLKGLRVGGGFRYYSDKSVYGIAFKGYSVADLMAAYQIKKISLTLNVNNILNEKYLIGTWGTSYVFPGAPRAFVLSVGYNW